jgi:hypothetical protein
LGTLRYSALAEVAMPHGNSVPPTDEPDELYPWLRNNRALTIPFMAEQAGQQDGMYPNDPPWGPPSPVASWRTRRLYKRAYRKGYRLFGIAENADPAELALARTFMGDEFIRAKIPSSCVDEPVWLVWLVEKWYPGAWKQLVRDVRDERVGKTTV